MVTAHQATRRCLRSIPFLYMIFFLPIQLSLELFLKLIVPNKPLIHW
jgi:hypothetical protein